MQADRGGEAMREPRAYTRVKTPCAPCVFNEIRHLRCAPKCAVPCGGVRFAVGHAGSASKAHSARGRSTTTAHGNGAGRAASPNFSRPGTKYTSPC